MFLFNLSLAEFLALAGLSSSIVVALYLLDRSRRAIVVSTLRFWTSSSRAIESTSRRRIRQWPSLLLQLASIVLLLLALAQLRLGSPDDSSRDHVLLLDTSSWMAARGQGATLIEQARAESLRYLRALPAGDRVMVVYADALATPQTAFESDRRKGEAAVRRARPTATALNLRQALDFASLTLRRHAQRPGEIVLAGGARAAVDVTEIGSCPQNLRLLEVRGTQENVGIRRLGLRPSAEEYGRWSALISVRNYTRAPRVADVFLSFGGAPAGSRRLRLGPEGEGEVRFEHRTRAAGVFEARVRSEADTFADDDRAAVEVPALDQVNVVICSDRPDLLRPIETALPFVKARFVPAAACSERAPEGIAVLDRVVPAQLPANAVLIEPPSARSPVPVASTAARVPLQAWRPDHPVAEGLRSVGQKLDTTQVFRPPAGDDTVAESSAGPVIVARATASGRLVVFGFHPMASPLRYEVSAPLVLANAFRWFAPEPFRRREVIASPAGSLTARLAPGGGDVRVVDEQGAVVPASRDGDSVHFFAGGRGTVRVSQIQGTIHREQTFSLALPEVPESAWEPPSHIRRGIPPARRSGGGSEDLWYWLALLAAAGFLADWTLFAPGVRDRSLPGVLSRIRRAA